MYSIQSFVNAMDPPSKRVRFSFTHAVQEIESLNKEQDDCWYSPSDFASFQETAKKLCREIHLGSCSKRTILDENPFNKNNQIVDDDDLQEGHTIRGLEVIANPTVGRKRRVQRCRVIQSVLIAQNTARETDDVKDLDVERFIAFFAVKESANARQFAHLMGKADESAILHPHQHQMSQVVAPSA